MDQRLIAIILSVGFRFVLLAIPALDYLWIWTMRRLLDCFTGRNRAVEDSTEDVDEGGQRIIRLQVIPPERRSPVRRPPPPILFVDSDSGTVAVTLISSSVAAACSVSAA